MSVGHRTLGFGLILRRSLFAGSFHLRVAIEAELVGELGKVVSPLYDIGLHKDLRIGQDHRTISVVDPGNGSETRLASRRSRDVDHVPQLPAVSCHAKGMNTGPTVVQGVDDDSKFPGFLAVGWKLRLRPVPRYEAPFEAPPAELPADPRRRE